MALHAFSDSYCPTHINYQHFSVLSYQSYHKDGDKGPNFPDLVNLTVVAIKEIYANINSARKTYITYKDDDKLKNDIQEIFTCWSNHLTKALSIIKTNYPRYYK